MMNNNLKYFNISLKLIFNTHTTTLFTNKLSIIVCLSLQLNVTQLYNSSTTSISWSLELFPLNQTSQQLKCLSWCTLRYFMPSSSDCNELERSIAQSTDIIINHQLDLHYLQQKYMTNCAMTS